MQLCHDSPRNAGLVPALRCLAAGMALCLAGVAVPGSFAAGQQPAPAAPGSAILPEQRAADDGFQNLMDKVLALRLEDDITTVAELLTVVAGAPGAPGELTGLPERELREKLLAACERSASRPTAGGGVEVDIWLPTLQLNELLRSVAAAHLPKDKHARTTLHSSAGPIATATGRYIPDGRSRDDRPGWRQCAPDQMAQTRTAVQLDIRRRLLDRVADMRVDESSRLRPILARFSGFRSAIIRRVDAVPLGEPVFEPTGVCRLTLSISRADLRAIVQGAVAESSKEELPPEAAEAADPSDSDPIVLTGFAVPPPYVPPPSRSKPLDEPGRPDWAERVLSAKATGSPPADVQEPQARREMALKAARLEAGRVLWLEMEKLPLGSGTLGEQLAGHPRMREFTAAIDALIVPTSSPEYDAEGRATVTLGVRLEPVWRIVRDLK